MILRRFGWWNLWLLAGPVALQIPMDLDSIADLHSLVAPLTARGYSPDDIDGIFSGNFLRFLSENLR